MPLSEREALAAVGSPPYHEPLPAQSGRGALVGWALLCVLAGALQAASLAWPLASWALPGMSFGQPSGLWQIVSLAALVLALQHSRGMAAAAWRGWLFATAWLAGTFWWLFISMHTYGGLPAPLAVLAVLALAGALALYYAVAAALLVRFWPRAWAVQALLFAALWTLAELARGRWFTGFPWGAGGYAQVDLLGGLAPWVGVYGMGFIAACLAVMLAHVATGVFSALASRRRMTAAGQGGAARWGWRAAAPAVLWLLIVGGSAVGGERLRALGQSDTAAAGELRVWLLQGNIAQDEKFVAGAGIARALTWYPQQIEQAVQVAVEDRPQLVVAPETSVPLLPQQLPASFWQPLLGGLASPGQTQPVHVLMGLPLGSYTQGYTNSAWGLSPDKAGQALQVAGGLSDPQRELGSSKEVNSPFYRYDKHHLVPFGEFIPPLFRWFTEMMNIPLGDFNRGGLGQAPWAVAGQRLAPNICYEDLFGEELAASFRDPASAPTVLVNLSNIAWFGNSIAIDQHLHISRLRALELGRPMLRATNTGATAVIDHWGEITALLPRLTQGRLEATVQGRSGTTLFARWASRWGVGPVWGLCLGLVLLILLASRWGGRTARGTSAERPLRQRPGP
jgi:apolipoprotein N-acyltransferase